MRNQSIAVPAPGVRRPAKEKLPPRVAGRPEARSRKVTATLERERHAADHVLLVAVVALTARRRVGQGCGEVGPRRPMTCRRNIPC